MRLILTLLTCLLAFPGVAAAQTEAPLFLVTEVVGEGEPSFWWSTAAPSWTATDNTLRPALAAAGIAALSTAELQVSKILRTPRPTDANALAIASVAGRNRVVVGTVTYAPSPLQPAGLRGWTARAELKVLSATTSGPRVDGEFSFERSAWASQSDDALRETRESIATTVARAFAAESVKRAGPVGVSSTEPSIAIRGAGTRGRLDAIRGALLQIAGVESIGYAWATEGLIALELNPGVADEAARVRGIATRLAQASFDGFRLDPVEGTVEGTVEFTIVEAMP